MSEPFKNFIHPGALATLAGALHEARPEFDAQAWLERACSGLDALELKARVAHGADTLRTHLAPHWPEALEHLLEALPAPMVATERFTPYFPWWIFCAVVERHGRQFPIESLCGLREMTSRWSAEFAVRPYLNDAPRAALDQLMGWMADENPHVRRWICEGTRPRLPWGERLGIFVADPRWTKPILEALVADPEPYVRRSVANHLGDIAKDHPQYAVNLARQWLQAHDAPDTVRLLRHGLRHLLKQGHHEALALFGQDKPVDLRLTTLRVTPRVVLGEALLVEVTLECDRRHLTPLRIDLVLGFRRRDGSMGRKVFTWTEATPNAHGYWQGQKSLPLRAVSTRQHHAGEQRVGIQINGELMGEATFWLDVP